MVANAIRKLGLAKEAPLHIVRERIPSEPTIPKSL